MWAFFTSKIGLYLIGAAVAFIAVGLFVNHIYQKGKQAERQAAIQRSVTALRDRGQINNETAKATGEQLCVALGGEWMPDVKPNGECL